MKKILVVDDNSAFTHLVHMALGRKGYDVVEENDPLRALETARRIHPDLILLDVLMPAMDGGDVCSQVREDPALRRTPVVFLSAIVSKTEVLSHRGHIGSDYFLAKPVTLAELINCIETQLGKSALGRER
jgi:CheY-like chemotaxis protein